MMSHAAAPFVVKMTAIEHRNRNNKSAKTPGKLSFTPTFCPIDVAD
jgi:hypothetical protein